MVNLNLRQKIERRIVREAIKSLLAAGCAMKVDDLKLSRDASFIFNQFFKGDEPILFVYKNNKPFGSIWFECNKNGWDILCGYSVNLEPHLVSTNTLAKKLEELYS